MKRNRERMYVRTPIHPSTQFGNLARFHLPTSLVKQMKRGVLDKY